MTAFFDELRQQVTDLRPGSLDACIQEQRQHPYPVPVGQTAQKVARPLTAEQQWKRDLEVLARIEQQMEDRLDFDFFMAYADVLRGKERDVISATARVAPEKAVFRPALPLAPQPEFTGEHMATMTYREQLLHPNWQRKRLEVMQRDEFRCVMCMDAETTLHVHHKQYVRGRLAWEYPADELVTLCEPCHEGLHEYLTEVKLLLAKLPLDGPGCIGNAMSLVAGFAHGQQGLDLQAYQPGGQMHFAIGTIARGFQGPLKLTELIEFGAALDAAPVWLRTAVLTSATKTLNDLRNEADPELEGAPPL